MAQAGDTLERLKAAIGAAARVLSGHADLALVFGEAGAAPAGRACIRLPEIPPGVTVEQARQIRGAADHAAFMLRHHDAAWHQRHMPAEEGARHMFSQLEALRVEMLGAAQFPGAAVNMEVWARREAQPLRPRAEPGEARRIALPDALLFAVRAVLAKTPVWPEFRQAVALWRRQLAMVLDADTIEQLRLTLHEQAAFAHIAHALIDRLGQAGMSRAMQENDVCNAPLKDKPAPSAGIPPEKTAECRHSPAEGGNPKKPPPSAPSQAEAMLQTQEQGSDGHDGNGTSQGLQYRPRHERAQPQNQPLRHYRAYTRRFDEIVLAHDLCSPQELRHLRDRLAHEMARFRANTAARLLAGRFRRWLQARERHFWMDRQEEGVLDAKCLPRLIADPACPAVNRLRHETPAQDTAVSILIDNSGSMRGRPALAAALSIAFLAQILERCGVKLEILGFTTASWRGGRAHEQWQRDGMPASPGRLNDVRHIIYKAADTPWRIARDHLAVMLHDEILKENIDGEALQWAYARLRARREQRRILLVISDGAPFDGMTLAQNPDRFLETHLRQVIHSLEADPAIDLLAIGIGHDVTRYYRRAVMVDDLEQLGATIADRLQALFSDHHERLPSRAGAQA